MILLEEKSIYFKNNFDSIKGISKENLDLLCEYFKNLKTKYNFKYENTHIYVTGIFRELSQDKKTELVKLFNDKFDLYFNIISHGIQNYYLEKAMNNNYNNKKVLVINMGGKTTELVTFLNNNPIKNINLNIGVADILNKFDKINEDKCKEDINEMIKFVQNKLVDVKLEKDYDCEIFTGGEEILNFDGLTNGTKIDENYKPDELDNVSADVKAVGMIYSFYGALANASTDVEMFRNSNLPPAFYAYGKEDPFYEQMNDSADALKEAGVPVESHVLESTPHGFGVGYSDNDWIAPFDKC